MVNTMAPCGCGSPGQLGSGAQVDGAAEVVGHHCQRQPGGVGHEPPRRQMLEAGGLELGDGEHGGGPGDQRGSGSGGAGRA